MADETTANYGWEKPDVAADDGTWGDILNDAWDAADTSLKGVQDLIGVEFISSATGTGTTLDIVVPATYDAFILKLGGVSMVSGQALLMQLSQGGAPITAAYAYNHEARQIGEAAPTYATSINAATAIKVTRISATSAINAAFTIEIFTGASITPQVNGAGGYGGNTINNGNFESCRFEGGLSSALRVTNLRFITDAGGSFTATYVLLGIKSS